MKETSQDKVTTTTAQQTRCWKKSYTDLLSNDNDSRMSISLWYFKSLTCIIVSRYVCNTDHSLKKIATIPWWFCKFKHRNRYWEPLSKASSAWPLFPNCLGKSRCPGCTFPHSMYPAKFKLILVSAYVLTEFFSREGGAKKVGLEIHKGEGKVF